MLFSRPALNLLLLMLLALLSSLLCTWQTLSWPATAGHWFLRGEQVWLQPEHGPALQVQTIESSSQGRIWPPEVQTIESSSQSRIWHPEAQDFVEDPDFVERYAEFNRLLQRQQQMVELAQDSPWLVNGRNEANEPASLILPVRDRSLSDLPLTFWSQMTVAFLALVISGWVWLVQPRELAPRLFFVSGLALHLAILPAAMYSSRAWGVPGDTLRWLSGLNHSATMVFLLAVLALLSQYPQRLIQPRRLLWLLPLVLVWILADQSQSGDQIPLVVHLPAALVCLGFVLMSIWQWQRSRLQPLSRAALRWFLLSVLMANLLILWNMVLLRFLDSPPVLSQASTILLFLIMYIGLALGLLRYRLFDMDIWTYRVLLWAGSSLVLIMLDGLLIGLTSLSPSMTLAASLFISGWIYLPLRNLLWSRLVGRWSGPALDDLDNLSAIAFASNPRNRQLNWQQLLQQRYQPLWIETFETSADQPPVPEVRLLEQGQTLLVRGLQQLPALSLHYPRSGTRLFNSEDVRQLGRLTEQLQQLLNKRHSYDQGVESERHRIGRDLHDNIGARLLRLLHQLRNRPEEQLARDAIEELRNTVNAMDSAPQPLDELLADLRQETVQRCEAAAVSIDWQQPFDCPYPLLSPRTRAMLTAILRELVSNALRHGQPRHLQIELQPEGELLHLLLTQHGPCKAPEQWQEGFGLRSLRGRLHELGGSMSLSQPEPEQLSFRLRIPVNQGVMA